MKTASTSKKGVALKTRYINAETQDLPQRHHVGHMHHFPIPIAQLSGVPQPNLQPDNGTQDEDKLAKRTIDGFYLLEVAGISFPEDVQHLVLSDRKLRAVVDEDLIYFTELMFLDVSENYLSLFPFGALPKLRELRLACNRIAYIEELLGFQQLMYLDLSYNQIHFTTIAHLCDLPLLKELDLSGNGLRALPPDLFRFEMLEKLVLQYNKFDDNSLFQSFAAMPALRYLDLSNNFFSSFPREGTDDGFKFMDTLDISFNFFASEGDVEGIVYLTRLETLLLYGNPVLGPTGEDPMFIYIERVVDKANQYRDDIKSTISYIDFVTEVPRRRVLKKGQPLGRLALYRDFSMVQVDARVTDRPNREWRRKGIQTIFGEMLAGRRAAMSSAGGALSSNPSAAMLVPDYTFITNSIVQSNGLTAFHQLQQQQQRDGALPLGMSMSNSQLLGGNNGMNKQLNEADRDAIADAVMRKVVNEMGLTGVEDLEAFRAYSQLPPTVVEQELRRVLEEEEDDAQNFELHPSAVERKRSESYDDDSRSPSRADLSRASGESSIFLHERSLRMDSTSFSPPPLSAPQQEHRRADRIPAQIFSSTNMVQPLPPSLALAAQPIELKTAMKALQRALEQPLTRYDVVPSRWSAAADGKDYGKPTRASQLRQLPRIPLSTLQQTTLMAPAAEEAKQQPSPAMKIQPNPPQQPRLKKKTLTATQQGLPEPKALKKLREEQRAKTLAQIDIVLDQLNAATLQMTTFEAPTAPPAVPAGRGGEEEPNAGIAQVRQSMDKMRNFARIKPGVSNLQNMAEAVQRDFS